ncbi:hypothetical protein [Ruegeria halocynthiae]|uniref:hypothetical protein n=1 Tax=Ruegeria halocynthiae TaxID=985054 RepID=UPI000568DBBB|nr:hypothetical protein [Ruegeria halocynthiae]
MTQQVGEYIPHQGFFPFEIGMNLSDFLLALSMCEIKRVWTKNHEDGGSLFFDLLKSGVDFEIDINLAQINKNSLHIESIECLKPQLPQQEGSPSAEEFAKYYNFSIALDPSISTMSPEDEYKIFVSPEVANVILFEDLGNLTSVSVSQS